MESPTVFLDLAVSLGLGLLVGLQRQRAGSAVAGIRTFPLISLAGSASALLPIDLRPWGFAAGLLAVATLALIGNLTRAKTDESPGVTTEAAMVLMYLVGALVVHGPRSAAVAVGAACAVLLHIKPVLHRFTQRLGESDVRAIMQFAVITLIILPVLPDRTFGPFDVLNPHRIWLMVVLVVAISLAAYVAQRLLGDRHATILGGLLGGLISSTATTASYSRRARAEPHAANLALLAIILASTVLYARVLVILWVVARTHWWVFAPPLLVMLAVGIACTLAARTAAREANGNIPAQSNPTQFSSALLFALLFAAVLFAAAAARHHFGDRGTLVVAALSGLTDLDAISLSLARLAADAKLDPHVASQGVIVALLANLVFKAILAAVLGGHALRRRVALAMGVQFAAGLVVLFSLA